MKNDSHILRGEHRSSDQKARCKRKLYFRNTDKQEQTFKPKRNRITIQHEWQTLHYRLKGKTFSGWDWVGIVRERARERDRER